MRVYGVSRSYVYRLRGLIPCFRFGGLRFKRADLDQFLDDSCRIGTVDEALLSTAKSSTPVRAQRRKRSTGGELVQLRARYGLDKL